MKKLSTYLFLLLFSFQVPSWADDISDFEIEGMSIGDSLLDYYSEEKIENEFEINIYKKPEKNKYARIYIENATFENFEYISIDVKYNDSKYIIHGVTGMDDDQDLKNVSKNKMKLLKICHRFSLKNLTNTFLPIKMMKPVKVKGIMLYII